MRRVPRPPVGLAALLAVAATAVGCGGDSAPPGSGFAQVNLQTATCAQWNEGSPQDRQAVVDRLEEVVAGPNDDGNTLADDVAYTTLDGRCEAELAQGFLLYQLYIRAAAFTSLAEEQGGE